MLRSNRSYKENSYLQFETHQDRNPSLAIRWSWSIFPRSPHFPTGNLTQWFWKQWRFSACVFLKDRNKYGDKPCHRPNSGKLWRHTHRVSQSHRDRSALARNKSISRRSCKSKNALIRSHGSCGISSCWSAWKNEKEVSLPTLSLRSNRRSYSDNQRHLNVRWCSAVSLHQQTTTPTSLRTFVGASSETATKTTWRASMEVLCCSRSRRYLVILGLLLFSRETPSWWWKVLSIPWDLCLGKPGRRNPANSKVNHWFCSFQTRNWFVGTFSLKGDAPGWTAHFRTKRLRWVSL